MWACTGNASRAPATAAMRHAPFFGDDGVDVADDGVITIIKYHHHRRRHQHQTAKSARGAGTIGSGAGSTVDA